MAWIWVDTREKRNESVVEYFEKMDYEYYRFGAPVGDYLSSDNMYFSIDLKNSLDEVCCNLCSSKEHQRFRNECILAKKLGIKLVVLVREDYIYNINGVKFWKPKKNKKGVQYSKVNGEMLTKIMLGMKRNYDIEWLFCKPNEAGSVIIRLLNKNGGNISERKKQQILV